MHHERKKHFGDAHGFRRDVAGLRCFGSLHARPEEDKEDLFMAKIIKDAELHLLMGKLRGIVGKDCRIIFKTTARGSQLLAAYYPDDEEEDEPDDNEPIFDFDEADERFKRGDMFKRITPKLEGRKHNLSRPSYFG